MCKMQTTYSVVHKSDTLLNIWFVFVKPCNKIIKKNSIEKYMKNK